MLNVAQQTLSEQLKISEREVEARLRLLGFTGQDAALLSSVRPLVEAEADAIVADFYVFQVAQPDIALLIGDADTLGHLKSAMRRYVVELFEGVYDLIYVNKRLRIGKVHHRIGVSPRLYLASLHHLECRLLAALEPHFPRRPDEFRAIAAALRRLVVFDQQLVFDTYIVGLTAQIASARDEAERHAATLEDVVAERTRALEELSRRDQLTGLLNQRAFYEALRRELSQAERHGQPLSLVYVDLDGFKAVNDRQGHLVGDEILRDVGHVMAESIREGDYACRYGGDEFCLILPGTTAEDARPVCDRMIELFRARHPEGLYFSMGVAQTGPHEFCTLDQIVSCADSKMYDAKAECRQRPGFHLCLGQPLTETPPSPRLRKKTRLSL